MKSSILMFIFVALTVFSFGLANAGDVLDITGPPTGAWDGGTKVQTGADITWTIHLTVDNANIQGATNAFYVYISDSDGGAPLIPGPGFTAITYDTLMDLTDYWDLGFFFNKFSVDGQGADTIGFGGVIKFGDGLPVSFDEDIYTITTSLDASLAGQDKYLCLDSCWYPPSNPFIWAIHGGTEEFSPDWGGPYCYEILSCCNMRGDADASGELDISDLTYLVSYMFGNPLGPVPLCREEGDADASGELDISDLTYLISYMFGDPQGPAPPPCP